MDISALIGMTPQALRARTEATVRAIHARMEALAPNDAYRECIESEVSDDTLGRITLGFPAIFVEHGAKPRNVSEPLLRSPSAKVSRDGHRYMSIKIGETWRTTSSARKPWMTKGKSGVGVIKRVLAEMPSLVEQVRGQS